MVSNNGSAEIVNMEAARARRRASELDGGDYPTAGAHLKAVREASGLSVDEVADRTHIKGVYLAAIEETAIEALPSRPFAIGFVKGYAEALGLDAPAVVARFKEDAGFSAPVEIEAEKFEAAQAAPHSEDRSDLSLLAVIAITLFILWCALQITMPRPENVSTPFTFSGPIPGAPAPAAVPAEPADEAGAGAEPVPLPVVVEAVLIDAVEPVYPMSCLTGAAAVETVEIAFNVTSSGMIAGERVAASSNGCFNAAALNAARRWRFSPRTVDGAPRPAYDLRQTVTFTKPA